MQPTIEQFLMGILREVANQSKITSFFTYLLKFDIVDQFYVIFLKKNGKTYFVLFLSEISIDKLKKFPQIEAWVQIACPRLSVDWGHFFDKPLLNTYEAHTAMMEIEWQDIYPMDYYSYDGGKWSNYYKQEEERKLRLAQRKSQKSTSAVDGSVNIQYEIEDLNA